MARILSDLQAQPTSDPTLPASAQGSSQSLVNSDHISKLKPSSSRFRTIARPPPINLLKSRTTVYDRPYVSSACCLRSPTSAIRVDSLINCNPVQSFKQQPDAVEPLDSPAFLKGDLNFSTFRERAARAIAEWGPSPTMSHFAELERRLTCTGGSKEACTSINHDLAISSADCICGDTCNTTSPSDITSDITSSSQASTPTPTAIKTPTPSHPSIQLGSTPQESSFTHCLIPSPSAFTIGGSTTVGYQPGSCGNLLSPYIRHHLPTLSPPASPFTPLTPGPHSKPSHRQAIDFKKPPSLKLTSSRQRRPPSLRLAQTDSYSESLIEEQLESLSLSRNVRFADGSPMKASTWHLTQYPSRLASPPISAANLSLADLIELESIKQSLGTWCGEIMGSPMRSSFSQSSIASSISEITGGSDDDYDGVKDDYDYDFIKGKLKEEDDSHGKNLDSIKSSAFKHKSMKGFGNLIIAGANQRQILGLDSSNDSKSGDMNSLNGSRKTSGELYSSPSSYAENKSLYNVDYDSWLESSDSESDCDSEIFEGVH